MGARAQRRQRRTVEERAAAKAHRAATGDAKRARRVAQAERFEREREQFFAGLPLGAVRVRS